MGMLERVERSGLRSTHQKSNAKAAFHRLEPASTKYSNAAEEAQLSGMTRKE